ncbi:alpha/beta fold hydrolase [Rhodococcus qingshengii]|uniref:alpha/beta fold hydrolase n=1 Tax=Rhodococcus qingshengii TaxID=334542 RepID=UPI0033E50241
MQLLSEHRRCISIDLPGHGHTPPVGEPSVSFSAIARALSPAAIPRETSSRSTAVMWPARRARGTGRIPPDSRRKRRIRGIVTPRIRSISPSDSPRRCRSQIRFSCSTVNPNALLPIHASTVTHHLTSSDALTC